VGIEVGLSGTNSVGTDALGLDEGLRVREVTRGLDDGTVDGEPTVGLRDG